LHKSCSLPITDEQRSPSEPLQTQTIPPPPPAPAVAAAAVAACTTREIGVEKAAAAVAAFSALPGWLGALSCLATIN
jgi:hypothetical protein